MRAVRAARTFVISLAYLVSGECLFHSAAFAADKDAPDVYDIPKSVAVQNRAYTNGSSGLTFQMGYLPLDAFNKSFVVGAAYTYNLSDYTSWEVFNFNNAFNVETDLKTQLLGLNLGVQGNTTSWLDYVNWYVTTGLLYTPFYNKSLMFNKTVLHNEFTFVLDAGTAKFEFYKGYRPVFGGGLILRYFLGQKTSLKFDFREQIYFGDTATNGMLSLIIGFQYQMGSSSNEVQ